MRFFALIVAASTLGAQQTAKIAKGFLRPVDTVAYADTVPTTPRLPGQTWRVHDADRPRPKKVAPGPLVSAPPPSRCRYHTLFDGKDSSHWSTAGRGGQIQEPKWKVESGYMEIVPRSGRLATKEKFGDCQLHIEWMIPAGTPGKGQDHGNSGVEMMMRYEVQVLESFENVTYADGQAAAMYGQWPPLVNASRPEGEWNVYDIMFEAPRFDKEKLVKRRLYDGGSQRHFGAPPSGNPGSHGASESGRLRSARRGGAAQPAGSWRARCALGNIWIRRLRPLRSELSDLTLSE